MSVKRDRDKTPVISWEDLSPFVTDIRGRLELAGLGSRGVNEFNVTLVHARPALEELAQHSGDPRFALYVLATARWRRLIPHEPRAPAWRKALEALEGDEALHRLLQDREAPRGQLRAALGDALAFLQTLGWQDEGLFDSRSIRKTAGGPRWAGHHMDRAAAVLKWHLHTGTRGRWDRLAWLARMLQTFGLIAPTGADPVPVERIKKRLQRLDIGFVTQFVIPDGRFFFHLAHGSRCRLRLSVSGAIPYGEFAPTACGLNWSILVFATAVEEAVFSVLDGYARAYAGLRQEVWQGYVRGYGRRYGRRYGRGYYRGY